MDFGLLDSDDDEVLKDASKESNPHADNVAMETEATSQDLDNTAALTEFTEKTKMASSLKSESSSKSSESPSGSTSDSNMD